MHDRYPLPSEMRANLRPSRQVHDDWSVAKPRKECQTFTYLFHDASTSYRPEANLKAQERFAKQLGVLERKQAREAKKRAKAAA